MNTLRLRLVWTRTENPPPQVRSVGGGASSHIHPRSSYIVVGTFNQKIGWIVKLPLECQKLHLILEWKFFELTAFLLQTNYVYHEIEFNLMPGEPGSLYSMILPYLGRQDISRPISVVNEKDFAVFVKNKKNEKNEFERTCGNIGFPIIRQSLVLPTSNLLDLAYIDSPVLSCFSN